jgi:hypothetical protein
MMVALLPLAAAAQARLVGSVVDSETGRPVSNASITIKGMKGPINADSSGQFTVESLPDEDVNLTIRRVGYAPGDFRIRVPATGVATKTFSLDFTGLKLTTIEVTARAEQLTARYTDFERRRQRGQGAFFRWDDLNKASFNSIGDALRTVRGVRMQCNQQTYECFAYMARSPTCAPVWIIDGQEARGFNENTPIKDVYGIEIYRGAGEVPGEYGGSNAACGVILVWTKSRPFRVTP